jgi:anthranilate synthase component 2
MIFILDNYDSFTYNLVHLVGRFRRDMTVRRNDEVELDEVEEMAPELIVISPGPGRPVDAGISIDLIQQFGKTTPILGVCLGHQAIGEAFGANVTYAPSVMHGKTSSVKHDGRTIYEDLPDAFEATRYHSLVVDRDTLPEEIEVSAWTDDGVVMGIRHKQYPIEGVQFHPESILTTDGGHMIKNWLRHYRREGINP